MPSMVGVKVTATCDNWRSSSRRRARAGRVARHPRLLVAAAAAFVALVVVLTILGVELSHE
jgi:hypothetical protein